MKTIFLVFGIIILLSPFILAVEKVCNQGYQLNSTTQECEKISTNESSPQPLCNSGYFYNKTTQRCEKEASPKLYCNSGYEWNSTAQKFEKINESTPTHVCAEGYIFNNQTQTCEANCSLTCFPSNIGRLGLTLCFGLSVSHIFRGISP